MLTESDTAPGRSRWIIPTSVAAAIAIVMVGGLVILTGANDDADTETIELSEAELLEAADFPMQVDRTQTLRSNRHVERVVFLDGCVTFPGTSLSRLDQQLVTSFEGEPIWELAEVLFADSAAVIADTYDTLVAQLSACLADPIMNDNQISYTSYAKRIEMPDIGDESFALVSGLYNIPTGFDPNYEQYVDEQFISHLYDEGVEPFCRHALGIVKQDDRIVIVVAVGRTDVKDLIESGDFAKILESATDRLAT